MGTRERSRTGFTLLELLVSLVIVALLVALLLPLLAGTRRLAHRSLCANNLRQLGLAWQAYMNEYEQFPQHTSEPDWAYGGVRFEGRDRLPVADDARPINAYLAATSTGDLGRALGLFEDPADRGIHLRDDPERSILPEGESCYEAFGTSYRANPLLLDSTKAGIDSLRRPLKVAEVTAQPSRLLLIADPLWYYAVLGDDHPEAAYDARWHEDGSRSGNMAAFDGSVRWVKFGPLPHPDFEIAPRRELVGR